MQNKWLMHGLLLFSLLLALPASQAQETFTIGYLQLQDDARYKDKQLFARYLGHALGRPYAGAEIALKEVKFHGLEAGVSFALEQAEAKDVADLPAQLAALQAKGAEFILLDLPADMLAAFSQEQREQALVFFNVSAHEDSLRNEQCQPNLFHTLPSYAMQYDALAQYLVSQKWRQVLRLEGASAADQQMSAAFARSAKKYGLKITETRPFKLGNDPREREQNNIALLTGGDQDVIFVADAQGEFARSVPYRTLQPNLIVGAEGLAPLAWHWAWERYGAPQLEKRFEKKQDRPMTGSDWAAWMAVKVVASAVQSTKSRDFNTLVQHLTAPDALFDNFKGTAGSFRPWNHQLRQPILLGTHNWVVDRAPLTGFLHQKNNLDTLGYDERESHCTF
ncbi:MAG: ABC transporter substrate-binding protein [Thiolinea sp.]